MCENNIGVKMTPAGILGSHAKFTDLLINYADVNFISINRTYFRNSHEILDHETFPCLRYKHLKW